MWPPSPPLTPQPPPHHRHHPASGAWRAEALVALEVGKDPRMSPNVVNPTRKPSQKSQFLWVVKSKKMEKSASILNWHSTIPIIDSSYKELLYSANRSHHLMFRQFTTLWITGIALERSLFQSSATYLPRRRVGSGVSSTRTCWLQDQETCTTCPQKLHVCLCKRMFFTFQPEAGVSIKA